MAKLGANSDADFSIHSTPPSDLIPLITADAMGTVFLRA